ncbi:MAG: CotH kinase family protein, partial [Lachnospiraceae bacterium]
RNYGSDYGELYKPDSMSFGGGRGNGKDFNMEDFMNTVDTSGESSESSGGITMPDMGGYDSSAMFGGEMPDKGNFDPSQMQGDMPQKPDMPQGNSENSDTSSFGGGRGDFNLSIDEETLRAAFEELNLDMALLDGIDFENITMESIQSVLSSLDEETMQKLMHEVMNSGSLEMPDMGGMGGFGGMGSADAKLQYIDDNASSYSSIWNSAKTDITTTDQTRLIESLKKLSNGEQIESVVDIEQVIRYFVVHNYVCNGDSYTGSMIHNYYLYEENGQMAMIPWDYNLAFGTFQGGNAQSTVNTPIDAPVSGSSSEDRPMWNWILSDETYIELYHQNFTDFMNTVDIGGIIDNAYNLIKSYVEKDPTAFYTYEEFENGVETMRQFCTLRSESISMQLTNGETTSSMNYVDASGLTLSDMGSMSMGGGFRGGDMQGMNGNKGSFGGLGPSDNTDATKSDASENSSSGLNTQRTLATTSEGMPQNGEMPEGFPGQSTGRTETIPSVDSGTSDNTGSSGNGNRPSGSNMQMPGGNFDMNGMGNATSNSTNWIWIAVSVLILGAGLIIAKLYKH